MAGDMIIGIDASKAAIKNRTGVENFVYELILNLPKVDKDHIFFLYTDQKLPKVLHTPFNFLQRYRPFPFFWNKIRLPFALRESMPDVYLQPAYMIPFSAPKKSIAIIHDFAWAKFPQSYTCKDRFLQKLTLRNIVKKAQKIICVSKSTKDDLVSYYPEAKERIEVVHLAGNSSLKKITHPRDVLGIKEKYFLSVGRLEERKNTKRIVEAFYKAKETGNLPHKLVLAGKPGFGYDSILGAISQNERYKKDVVVPGYVKEQDINDLFSGAEALLYPSIYEGFGITALDAMKSGTPVITSDSSSLPEVVGNAAILVDPLDISQIAAKMVQIAGNKKLREELIDKGLRQAEKFSWPKTAREIIELLEKL